MSNPITTADGGVDSYHEFRTNPNDTARKVVTLQGDANDFSWSLQQSIDGSNWVAMTDGNGDSSYTGCRPIQFLEAGGVSYRVIVTSLGTATSVAVANN